MEVRMGMGMRMRVGMRMGMGMGMGMGMRMRGRRRTEHKGRRHHHGKGHHRRPAHGFLACLAHGSLLGTVHPPAGLVKAIVKVIREVGSRLPPRTFLKGRLGIHLQDALAIQLSDCIQVDGGTRGLRSARGASRGLGAHSINHYFNIVLVLVQFLFFLRVVVVFLVLLFLGVSLSPSCPCFVIPLVCLFDSISSASLVLMAVVVVVGGMLVMTARLPCARLCPHYHRLGRRLFNGLCYRAIA